MNTKYSSLTSLGIVVATTMEAKLLSSITQNYALIITGTDLATLDRKIQTLKNQGVKQLIGFGTAGGLNPQAKLGTVILPTHIINQDNNSPPIDISNQYTQSVHQNLRPHFEVWNNINTVIAQSNKLVHTAQDKAYLFNKTKATAVDMESYTLACIAKKYNLPLVIIRLILDTAEKNIPSYASSFIATSGKLNYLSACTKPWMHPKEIAKLWDLYKDYCFLKKHCKSQFKFCELHP